MRFNPRLLITTVIMFGASSAMANGEVTYKQVCMACHGAGVAGAPKVGDKAKWAPLIKEGQATLTAHGYVGVRQIEVHITNTMGWSATTGQVQPWVYKQLTETFLLDPKMRERLAQLNPTAALRMGNRLSEASQIKYRQPTEHMKNKIQQAKDDLEDLIDIGTDFTFMFFTDMHLRIDFRE
jgi:hypothetical protein